MDYKVNKGTRDGKDFRDIKDTKVQCLWMDYRDNRVGKEIRDSRDGKAIRVSREPPGRRAWAASASRRTRSGR